MNIFQEPENFIERSGNSPLPSIKTILELADEIKTQMGKKAYLLDKYLSIFFEAVSELASYDAEEKGFHSGLELYSLCNLIDSNDEKAAASPFYEKAQEFIKDHPLDFEEPATKKGLYFCLLSDEYFKMVLNKFTTHWSYQLFSHFDTVALGNLFDTICSMIDTKKMEQLNGLLYGRFFRAFLADFFVRGFNHNLSDYLTYRDPETKKQLWEFITQV